MPWERLGRESGRYTREEKWLEEAAQLLGLKEPPRVIERATISPTGAMGRASAAWSCFRTESRTVRATAALRCVLSRARTTMPRWQRRLCRAAEYRRPAAGKPDGPAEPVCHPCRICCSSMAAGAGRRQSGRPCAARHWRMSPTFGMVRTTTTAPRAIVDDAGGEIAINRNRNIFTFVTNIQGRNAPLRQRLPQARDEKALLRCHADGHSRCGEKTSAALLAHFKTVAAVKAASISDLEEVKGISHAKAEMLANALPEWGIMSVTHSPGRVGPTRPSTIRK